MATAPTQTIIQKAEFPEQLAPYLETLAGQAAALTDTQYNPYMQYMGDRVAQFSPMMRQSYESAGMMQAAPQMQDATAMAGLAGLGALNTGYTYDPFTAESVTQPGMTQAYMSPYMQNVVDIQKREAARQSEIQRNVNQAQAVGQGAYGGSRQAIVEAERQRNLGQQMGDIQLQGSQAAYQQAMQQFNAEQAQRLGAGQLNAQQGQYGAGLGLQGLQTALTGASTLGNLGQTQFGQDLSTINLQNTLGMQQQQQAQNILNTQYQDYTNAMKYPYQQLGFFSDMLRGLPLTTQTQQMFNAPPSTTSQLVGLGTAAAGFGKLFGSKEGGIISLAKGGVVDGEPEEGRYAKGGIAMLSPVELDSAMDHMGDRQLAQAQGLASITDLAKIQIAQRLAQNNMIRKAAANAQASMQQRPQSSIAEEEMAKLGGIADLDVPDETFSAAEGGIVAFANQGSVNLTQLEQRVANAKRMLNSVLNSGDVEAIAKYQEEYRDAMNELSIAQSQPQASDVNASATDINSETEFYNPPQERIDANIEDAGLPNQGLASIKPNDSVAAAPAQPGKKTQAPPGEGMSLEEIQKALLPDKLIQNKQVSETMLKQAGEKDIENKEMGLQSYDKLISDLGVLGKDREKSITEEKEKLKGQEDKNTGWALVEAGLAIAGGASPNAIANIAAGAQVGTKAYKEGLEKIANKREKLDDKLEKLMDARRSEKMLTGTKRIELENDINKAKGDYEKSLAAFFHKNNVEFDAKMLEKSVELFMQQEQNIRTTKATEASANKDTDWQRRFNAFKPMVMKTLGISDPNSPEVQAMTAEMVDRSQGYAAGKSSATSSMAELDARERAAKITSDEVLKTIDEPGHNENKKWRKILLKEGQGAADKYKKEYTQRLFDANLQRINAEVPQSDTLFKYVQKPNNTPPDISQLPPGSKGYGKLTDQGWEVLDGSGKIMGYLKKK